MATVDTISTNANATVDAPRPLDLPPMDQIVGRIMIFSTSSCKHCKAAKALLQSKGAPYVDVNLEDFPGRRAEVVSRSNGRTTVPQIFFNSLHIGGNSDLQEIEKKGELDALIIKTLTTKVPEDAPLPPSEADLAEIDAKRMKENEIVELQGTPILKGVVPNSPDEANLLKILRAIRKPASSGGLLIKHYWYNLQRYHTCFIGSDLITWLVDNKFSNDREHAKLLAQRLMRLNIIHHLHFDMEFKDDYEFYRFYQDEDRFILNTIVGSPPPTVAATPTSLDNSTSSNGNESNTLQPKENARIVSSFLRKQISDIYGKYLLPDGSALDYEGVADSEEFSKFCVSTARLNFVDISELSNLERKVVFINLYNALIIHGQISIGHPKSIPERGVFFTSTAYMIGGLKYTLNDIEHGILRGNKPPPFQVNTPFGRSDPRRFHALPLPTDYRIHFALNCGARSCPSVKLYSLESLEEELDLAARAFCEDKESFDLDESKVTVYLSKIFFWYESDFGADIYERLATISKYLPQEKAKIIHEWVEKKVNINVILRDYNWDQNSTKNKPST